MPIVNNGRVVEPVTIDARPARIFKMTSEGQSVSPRAYLSKLLNLKVCDGKYGAVATGVRGKKIPQTLDNLAVIRNAFGLSISDSVYVALNLTANAIREGRFNVA